MRFFHITTASRTVSLHPGEAPGHGVDIDEREAARFPYERAYLPIAHIEDGTVWNW